ncbi:DnaJ family molecular chaperone [Nitratireductor sp. ZSWI3]|uniref:J domain-containing protein n=1 Tax=Nitratireductor sp. ZSWI3 TaxID=2966359 RepID=UPI00214FC998|nr:DnaJ family molecular chaperone [Nitratireductor sp. ZSWI3]MCR4266062.1 DnaJ family molecular chaperone [Nitratireductor sp. ZSWI3]
MTFWDRITDFITRAPGSALSAMVEAVRTVFEGDPQLRRRVAFSIAIIALSAKMAKADGVVTPDEVQAFHEIFAVPREEMANVSRLYRLAQQDVAGFEAYARQMAGLCGYGGPNCLVLEDILDALFHIAKADGVIHERENEFLQRVAEIFSIEEAHFEQILSRHAITGDGDPYLVLGVGRDATFDDVKKRYRKLVLDNHPDRLIARGVPEEFLAIANTRIAAINAAFERIEKARVGA